MKKTINNIMMNEKKLILASGSPRRRELLETLGTAFTVKTVGTDESHGEMPPEALVMELSGRKAGAVFASLSEEEAQNAIVVGCDTVVALDGKILEKPKSETDAFAMLRALSGKSHAVCSGLTVRSAEKELRDCVTTEVCFRELTDEEISAYIATGEPMDKAGAYGIQGKACSFVRELHGDYYTVMGMPVCRLTELLRHEFCFDLLKNLH